MTEKNLPDVDANELQRELLQAQLDCVLALVARGVNARAAIALVVLACIEAEAELSS